MKNLLQILSTVAIFISFGIFCNTLEEQSEIPVINGADLLITENFDLIKNKTIGIVTNHTGVLSGGTHLVDTLYNRRDVKIKALFSPEHGIRGDNPRGTLLNNAMDNKTGLPVYALYGKSKKPTKEMLSGIDVILFDIQDIGTRFYTYISTLFYVVEACTEYDIPLIVLDRPNPLGGLQVDGPILNEKYKSFVGLVPIPIIHGMTIGELATMFNESEWIKAERKANLTVIKMKNWKRDLFFDDCGLQWIKPSFNITDPRTAIVYPGTCLLENTNISEGRGTNSPFLQFGAPFIDSKKLLDELNILEINSAEFIETNFTPSNIDNIVIDPVYKGETCYGLKITINDKNIFEPVKFGVKLLYTLHKLYPDKLELNKKWLNLLFGDSYLYDMILEGNSPDEIIANWQKDVEDFKSYREKFLLY